LGVGVGVSSQEDGERGITAVWRNTRPARNTICADCELRLKVRVHQSSDSLCGEHVNLSPQANALTGSEVNPLASQTCRSSMALIDFIERRILNLA